MKYVLIGIALFTLPPLGLYQAIVGSFVVSIPITFNQGPHRACPARGSSLGQPCAIHPDVHTSSGQPLAGYIETPFVMPKSKGRKKPKKTAPPPQPRPTPPPSSPPPPPPPAPSRLPSNRQCSDLTPSFRGQ